MSAMVGGEGGIEGVRRMEVTVSWGWWRKQQPSRSGGWRTSLTTGGTRACLGGDGGGRRLRWAGNMVN